MVTRLTGVLLLICIVAARSLAQVNININSSNITGSSIYVDNLTTTYNQGLGLFPSIKLASSATTFSGGTLGVGLVSAQIVGTGGGVANLLDLKNTPLINLSTTAQAIYNSVIGTLSGGGITIRYTIPGLSSTTWKAGTYTTNLNFTMSGLNVGSLSPVTAPLNINVSAFITATALSPVQLSITSLDYFRQKSITATQALSLITTVPFGVRFKSSASGFAYSNGYAGANNSQVPVSLLAAQLTPPVSAQIVSVATGFQNLSPAGGFDVPAANQQSSVVTYTISPDNLKANFFRQGTYTSTLNYEVFDTGSTASTQSLSCPVTITVSDLAELIVNQADVNLNFNTATDYAKGVYTDQFNHLKVSKTTPFDVYVRAANSTMANGAATLPVNLITLSPTPDATSSFSPISLSATAQKLISGADPVIDRSIGVRYAIPAANTGQLLGKTSGTYNATIIYSMVAP